MKRALLFILVVLVGLGGYFWYKGDARTWFEAAKEYVTGKPSAAVVPASGRPEDATIVPGTAPSPYAGALAALSAQSEDEQIRAWSELSKAYLSNQPGAAEAIIPELTRFVDEHVLSRRLPSDIRIAARVNVQEGDSLARLASRHTTTVEAIKRFNGLADGPAGDTIRPGLTLKVLNQRVAIFIRKSAYKLWVTYGDKVLREMPCGIGKENRTPAGNFVIAERKPDPDWFPANGKMIPAGDPANELGSRWLGFKDTPQHTGLGIHEARNREDVGKQSSNGCIRLYKEDVELLFDLAPEGTPVKIMD